MLFYRKTYIVNCKVVDVEIIKRELEKKSYKLVEKNDKYMCFRGNYSYKFFVGDINVEMADNEMKLSGTKYVLDKIITKKLYMRVD